MIVVIKLPYRLRDRWRAVASDIQETRHRRTTFPDIMAFAERQVKIAVEPVSGSIQDAPKDNAKQRRPQRPLTRNQGCSFATTVTSVDGREVQVRNEGAPLGKKICLYCKVEHALELHCLLEKRAHNDKIAFEKDLGTMGAAYSE